MVIKCKKMKRQDLSETQIIDNRVFYWAAHNGLVRYLKLMVEVRKWSPYIKSFRNRSILSAAIWGSQVPTVRMLLGDYHYAPGVARDDIVNLSKTIFNKDDADNNSLHYSYMIDLPEVRQILRDNDLYNTRSQRLNRRGQLPTQLRHSIKAEDSGDDTEDDAQYDAQQAELEIVGDAMLTPEE